MSSNTEILRGMYADFVAGKFDEIIANCDNNIVWMANTDSTSDKLPWRAPAKGKVEARAFFDKLLADLEFTKWDPHTIFGEEDKVMALADARLKHCASGRELDMTFVHVWEFTAEGKVVRFSEYTDTARYLEACGALSP